MRNLLFGNNIKLNAINEGDLVFIEDWFNDVKFLRHYDMLPAIPQTNRDVKKAVEEFTHSNNSYMFAIRTLETNKIVGVIGLFDIMWTNGVATFFIGIGNQSYVGKGIGREAMELLLDFGFNELNLYRIQLNVIEYNEKAIRAYERIGFIKEGTHRELVNRDGRRYDLYLYGLLKHEWTKRESL
jgi:RimJ/RimL family protein N-acetyltransferase